MAVIEVSIVPIGSASSSLSAYVAKCLEVLQKAEGIGYQLTPMGTIIEGELDRVLSVVREMHEQPFLSGSNRVLTTVRIDDRRDRQLTMAGKVASVEKKMHGAAK